ncbi:LOW QUALITY PROTEIN: hypothetical protein MAR_006630, partial [Mya arenaria]
MTAEMTKQGTLIVAEHVLSSTVALTNQQKAENDILHAIGEAKVVTQLMNNERNDPDVWGTLYEKATNVAAEFDRAGSNVVTRPRGAGRQNHRANPDVDTVADYWRITLSNVVLDHLIQEMETRILSNEDHFAT